MEHHHRKIVCYIAAPGDSLDWLMKTEGEGDAGYAEFMETVDTLICGRRTYDWVVEREGGSVSRTNLLRFHPFARRNKPRPFLQMRTSSFLETN